MSSPSAACPACGGNGGLAAGGKRRICIQCGTIWVPSRCGYTYDDTYPEQRAHHDAVVLRCKQVTLDGWARRTGVKLPGRQVLEVGFGGGATLEWLQGQGAVVSGQEPVAANRDAAVRLGIPAANLAADLAAFQGRRFDLLVYLDSFEHLPDPAAHLALLASLTGQESQALVVLPVADSFSRRLLGSAWPHDIADHWVFYSTGGLAELWRRSGWRVAQRFYPWKYVSALTLARHWHNKTGMAVPLNGLANTGVWLNFGERGLLFERL